MSFQAENASSSVIGCLSIFIYNKDSLPAVPEEQLH